MRRSLEYLDPDPPAVAVDLESRPLLALLYSQESGLPSIEYLYPDL